MKTFLQNRFIRIFIVALAYFVTGKIGTILAIPPGVSTPLWPPSGIAVAAIFLWGYQIWPGVFLGSVLVNFGTLYDPALGSVFVRSFVIASGIATGSALQALVIGGLLRQFLKNIFEKIGDVLRFVLIAPSCCLIAATVGTTSLLTGHYITGPTYLVNWLTWWAGDLIGVLVFTPLVITWREKIKEEKFIQAKQGLEVAFFCLLLAGVFFAIQASAGLLPIRFRFYFPYIPFVVWSAIRFRQFTMMLVTVIISVLAVIQMNYVNGSSGIVLFNRFLLVAQSFIGVSVFTGLLLSASLYERRRFESDLRQAHLELKSKVAEIQSSNLQMEQFTHMVSHDLQEPLHTIIGFIERLKQNYEDSLEGKGRDYVDRIGRASWRMSQLIDALLAYSRVTRKPASFEAVSLKKVLQDIVSDLQIRLVETRARIEIGEVPDVYGNRLQLQQLFQNLISNGLKFHRKDTLPRVKISSRPLDNESVAIHVEDNGIGIEKQFSHLIFKPFERLNPRKEYEGSGLGLAICRKIAEHHGGQIHFRSTPGEGSVFTVVLPGLNSS